jgi:hypothetical protein
MLVCTKERVYEFSRDTTWYSVSNDRLECGAEQCCSIHEYSPTPLPLVYPWLTWMRCWTVLLDTRIFSCSVGNTHFAISQAAFQLKFQRICGLLHAQCEAPRYVGRAVTQAIRHRLPIAADGFETGLSPVGSVVDRAARADVLRILRFPLPVSHSTNSSSHNLSLRAGAIGQ